MTKQFSNYSDLLTFTRASGGHALRPCTFTETAINGGFDTDTSWNKGTGWSIGSGVASIDGSQSAGSSLYQSKTVTAGDIIRMTVEVTAITSGTIAISYANGTGSLTASPYYATSSTGTIQRIFTVTGSGSVNFVVSGSTSAVASVDNVSIATVAFDQPDGTLTLFEHPNNVPRVEWDADRNRLGLLVEESRTNKIYQSEDFTDSNWVSNALLAFGSGSTSNATAAPDGTTTADLIVPDTTSSNAHWIRHGVAGETIGNDYTISVYVKAAGYTTCSLRMVGTDAPIATFDLSAETTTQSAATITNVGNGWYRCTLTGEATSTTVWHYIYPNQQATFTGDGISGIYVWGAQLEAGSFPTSYMKTTGATATRSSDVASIPVADFGYNNKEITVMAEFIAPSWASSSTYHRVLSFDGKWGVFNDGSVANGTVRYRFDNDSDVAQFGAGNLDTATYGTSETMSKVAFALKNNDAAITKDGNAVGTDTAGDYDIELRTTLTIGAESASANYLNGHLKTLKVYPRRLTNAQLQDLTS